MLGRKKILTSRTLNGDISNDMREIPLILQEVMPIHSENVAVMKRLINYYYNQTDIYAREKVARPDVCNKVSVNRACAAVTTINSYTFSNPFKFVGQGNKKRQYVAFNNALKADNYSSKLQEMTFNAAMTGLGYKYVCIPTEKEKKNGLWFKTVTEIDPLTAFCVYSNTIRTEKVMGVMFFERYTYDEKGKRNGTEIVYNVFTKWHHWTFIQKGNIYTVQVTYFYDNLGNKINATAVPYDVEFVNNIARPIERTIPLLENKRKYDNTNDFELSISLINAINTIVSNATDCVEQNADYIFKFRNVDIGTWDENGQNAKLDNIKRAIKNHILAIDSIEGASQQPDAEIMEIPLNQSEVRALIDFLKEELEISLCVPNRNTSTSSTETGTAIETRNGYRSLEDIAAIITNCALETEKEFVVCALEIAQSQKGCPFASVKPSEIDIKPMRNKVESVISATQAYSTLRSAGMNDISSLEITGLVADPVATAEANIQAKEEEFGRQLDQQARETEQSNSLNNNANTNTAITAETAEANNADGQKTE